MTYYPDNTNFAALSRHLGEFESEAAELRRTHAAAHADLEFSQIESAVNLYAAHLRKLLPFADYIDGLLSGSTRQRSDVIYGFEGSHRDGFFRPALELAIPDLTCHGAVAENVEQYHTGDY